VPEPVLEVGEDVPPGPRPVLAVAGVGAQRGVEEVERAVVEDRVGPPLDFVPEQRERVAAGLAAPPLVAVRQPEIAPQRPREQRGVHLTPAPSVVVAVVAPEQEGREADLEVALLPALHGLDDVELSRPDGDPVAPARPHLDVNVVADVIVLRREAARGAGDHGRANFDDRAPEHLADLRPELDR
jgi:hypothetical protein